MMYRGHIPKRKEDPEPTKDTAYELRRYCVLPWSVCDTDIVYALLLITTVYVVPELTALKLKWLAMLLRARLLLRVGCALLTHRAIKPLLRITG